MADESAFPSVLARAMNGDEESFERLFENASEALFDYCDLRLGRRLREQVEPFDIVQEAYLQAIRSIEAVRAKDWEGFVRWLYQIAENRIRALNERTNAAKRTPAGTRLTDSRAIEALRARVTGPITRAVRREEIELLHERLGRLDDPERALVVRHYMGGESVSQIAESLDIPETTARRTLARALTDLSLGFRSTDE